MQRASPLLIVAGIAVLSGGIAARSPARNAGNASGASGPQQGAEAAGSETVYFFAQDGEGKPITDLKAEELSLRLDGKPVQFARLVPPEKEPPLTLQVLLDVSGSRNDQLPGVERKYAYGFFKALLRPGDRAFVWEFNDETWLLTSPQDSTDPRALAAEVASGSRLWDSTALFDAILKVCENVPRNSGDRAVMLLVSDGDDNSSRHRAGDVEGALQRDNLQLFVINLGPATPSAADVETANKDKLKRARRLFKSLIGNAVGGAVLEAANKNDFHDALDHILEYLGNEYGVTFILPAGLSGEKTSQIAIGTTRPGVTIVGP